MFFKIRQNTVNTLKVWTNANKVQDFLKLINLISKSNDIFNRYSFSFYLLLIRDQIGQFWKILDLFVVNPNFKSVNRVLPFKNFYIFPH